MIDKEQGWLSARLEELLIHVIGGDWGKGDDYVDDDFETVSCIRGSEFKNWKTELGATAVTRRIKSSSLATRQLVDGDLLIEISGGGPDQPVGRTVLITEQVLGRLSYPAVCTNFLRLARPSNYFNSAFLNHYLAKFYNSGEVVNYQGGSNNLRNLKFKEYSKIEIPIPPLAEQKVIADKLNTLLAQVETTKARLERIPETLKTFRQSVLAAAVSGKLTEKWRENEDTVWQSLVIDDIGEVKGGKRLPKGDELVEKNTGFPYIRAGQLKQGTVINTNDARSKQLFITPETQAKISRYTVNSGDLYITIVGASIGDAGVIPEHYSGANLTENAAKITQFKKPVKSEFLSYWLRSQELQDLIKLEIKSGAQGKLALKRIKELPVPYTDEREQTEIVRRVEELLAFANNIEQKANAALERVNNLTQSILAKAFRGELTADWRGANPDLINGENSAASLLKKIKAEQQKLRANKPRKPNQLGG